MGGDAQRRASWSLEDSWCSYAISEEDPEVIPEKVQQRLRRIRLATYCIFGICAVQLNLAVYEQREEVKLWLLCIQTMKNDKEVAASSDPW